MSGSGGARPSPSTSPPCPATSAPRCAPLACFGSCMFAAGLQGPRVLHGKLLDKQMFYHGASMLYTNFCARSGMLPQPMSAAGMEG